MFRSYLHLSGCLFLSREARNKKANYNHKTYTFSKGAVYITNTHLGWDQFSLSLALELCHLMQDSWPNSGYSSDLPSPNVGRTPKF